MTKEQLEVYIGQRRQQHMENLQGWSENGGYLLPTEPDPEERARVRERLKVAIHELEELAEEFNLQL